MPDYLEPVEDGLVMRESGAWVTEKLDYLKRYIEIFEKSMRNIWPRRNFVDLFAGPGKCYDRKSGAIYLGSPIIALTTQYPFTNYFFVDYEPENISALRERCGASHLLGAIKFFADDGNQVVNEIVTDIRESDRKEKSNSLNLAFLDPDGLDLNWNTVATLASVPKMDLIIHYPVMGLKRMLEVATKRDEHAIDLFFGDKEWRTIYGKSKDASVVEQELLLHYKQKLENLGYKEVVQKEPTVADPAIKNTRQGLLYRLLFASKNPLGDKFWKEVTKRNMYGQRKLF